jgi:ribosomal RNA-processing protein 12
VPSKPVTGTAFEDVLYGDESNSEADASDNDDDEAPHNNAKKKHTRVQGARLRMDNDEPMDLLEGAATHVTSSCTKITLISFSPTNLTFYCCS